MRPVVTGHLMASRSVHSGPWRLTTASREHPPGAEVMGWDPELDVTVTKHLEVDRDALLAEVGQHPDAVVEAVLLWHATGSGLRGAGPRVLVHGDVIEVNVELAGGDLGGTLVTEVVLLLASPSPNSPLGASEEGAALWREHTQFHLEGDGSRLQTQELSFAEEGIGPAGAAWVIRVEEAEFDELAGAQVTLQLNRDHPAVAAKLLGEDVDEVLLESLKLEVERRLVEHALDREDELDESVDYDEGSFGELMVRAVRRNFPGQTITQVARLRRMDRGEFEMTLQANTRYLA